MINIDAYRELVGVVGPENLSQEPAICDSYAAQPFHRNDVGVWINRPGAVILPGSTEEVSQIIKICNKYKLRYKAHSTGFGALAGPDEDGVLQVDLRRMNRLIELDEKNMIAVVEPYTSGMHVQIEAMKKGLNLNIITAGPHTSPLASTTSHSGGGASSCSMAYNARNLLACEWVSPTGEIIRIGSPDTGSGWYSVDGPGPSMRGIVRGYFGYQGGLGIFTKAAIKLYHWAGPEELKAEGHLFDAQLEVPQNFHSYMLFFPSWDTVRDAFYAMAETEVTYFMNKFSGIILGYSFVPNFMEALMKYPNLRNVARATQHCVQVIVAGNSEGDLAWKAKTLKKIVDEQEGFMFGGHPETPFDKCAWLCNIKAAQYLMLFGTNGTFHVSMGADESIEAIMKQGKEAEVIKAGFVEKEMCFDDGADGTWACVYEQSPYGHCEATMMFNPNNPAHVPAIAQYSEECADVLYEKHLGGVGFCVFGGKEVLEKFNAVTSNFWGVTKRIKKAWDPQNLGNLTVR